VWGYTNGEQILALTLTAKVMTEGLKQFVKGGIYNVYDEENDCFSHRTHLHVLPRSSANFCQGI
jgi:hypothetical protein